MKRLTAGPRTLARANQKVAADFFTRRPRRRDERRAAVQTIRQQKGLGGHLGQQLQGHRPFGLAAPSDGRRQRIVQAQFEQDAGGDFGKGGAAAAAFGFARGGLDLRGIGQAEKPAGTRVEPWLRRTEDFFSCPFLP